jgi:soluble lytic murein transglycosylase-like protein
MSATTIKLPVTLSLLAGAATLAYAVKSYGSTPYDALFEEHGRANSVAPNLLRAIARRESTFRPQAVGLNKDKSGRIVSRDLGLMQINEKTAPALGIHELSRLFDPSTNIGAAARLLKLLRDVELRDDDLHRIVSAYNVGSPTVKARGIVNPEYVGTVLFHYQMYNWGRMFA